MTKYLIYTFVNIKKVVTILNHKEGKLSEDKKEFIVYTCNKILLGYYDIQFLLNVWQTGSVI